MSSRALGWDAALWYGHGMVACQALARAKVAHLGAAVPDPATDIVTCALPIYLNVRA